MMYSTFVRLLVKDFLSRGCYSTACHYLSSVHCVMLYAGHDVSLRLIFTRGWLESYQRFLLNRDLQRNTVAFYMRTLRSVYYKAIEKHHASSISNLFSGLITTDEATIKRSIPASVVLLLAESDLSSTPHLEFSRDMFLLSLYLQGMPYVDLANLRKSDFRDDSFLQYRRRKTGVEIMVGVIEPALKLLRKYRNTDSSSPYLLPILPFVEDGALSNRLYRNSLRNYNRHLKQIASLLHISEPLSSYVCRHTWATLAHHQGVGIHIISQALGHRKEETTHTYVRLLHIDSFLSANNLVQTAIFGNSLKKKKNKNSLLDTSGVLLK